MNNHEQHYLSFVVLFLIVCIIIFIPIISKNVRQIISDVDCVSITVFLFALRCTDSLFFKGDASYTFPGLYLHSGALLEYPCMICIFAVLQPLSSASVCNRLLRSCLFKAPNEPTLSDWSASGSCILADFCWLWRLHEQTIVGFHLFVLFFT